MDKYTSLNDCEKYNLHFKLTEKILLYLTKIKEVVSIMPSIDCITIYTTDINLKDKIMVHLGDTVFFNELAENELFNIHFKFEEVKPKQYSVDYNIINNTITEEVRKGLIFLSYFGSTCHDAKLDTSDTDIIGITIPPKEIVFPYFQEEIPGFTKQVKHFEQFEIKNTLCNNLEGLIYGIVKYFKLCMDNNPNMIDSLYINPKYHLYNNKLFNLISINRDLFLSKKVYYKFVAYAYSQHKKMHNLDRIGKRKELVESFGYDTKYASHLVRLLLEAKQILKECALDLDKNGNVLKDIKQGKWKLEDVDKFFEESKIELEELYKTSKLQEVPNYEKIKKLLVCILAQFYDLSLSEFWCTHEMMEWE